jgi:hypothetical protein
VKYKRHLSSNEIELLIIVGVLMMIFTIIGSAVILFKYVASLNTVPTPSYQAQNLEMLKTAQPKDILLCETQSNSSQPKVQRALLVDKNDGERLVGTVLGHWSALRTEKDGLPILAVSSWQCKFRIVKDAAGKNEILTIILHDPDKLAQTN